MSILPPPASLLDAVFAALAAHGLPRDLPCDHICYRVATMTRYEELREALKSEGVLVSESMIAGRPIATFRLLTPYIYL